MKRNDEVVDYAKLNRSILGISEPISIAANQNFDFDKLIDNVDFSQFDGKDFKSEFSEIKQKVIVPRDRDVIVEYNQGDNFDNSVMNTDFAQFKDNVKGGFKKSFSRLSRFIDKKVAKRSRPKEASPIATKRASTEEHFFDSKNDIGVEHNAKIDGGEKVLSKITVPRERQLIVQGVNKFILSENASKNAIRSMGYYKGKKLKKLIFVFNNNSAVDFNLELFNPSMPLDYLYSTSLNLNDKIEVAGSPNLKYSDVLFNLLANPTMIANAVIVAAPPVGSPSLLSKQLAQAMIVKNKNIDGETYINPLNPNLSIDTMQYQPDIAYMNISELLNRPFVPDGMDVIQYKVLAGMTVTICFYYKQVSLKKLLLKEARENKIIV